VNDKGGGGRVQPDEGLLKVREVSDAEQWDNLVRTSTAGTLFHTTLWQDCSPHTFIRLGIYRYGSLLAGAAVQVNEPGDGRVESLAPYIGPVAISGDSDEEHRRVVSLLATSLKEKVSNVMFYASPWFDTLQPFVLAGFSVQLFYTTIVQTESVEAAWSRLTPSLRRNIRRAESDGCAVKIMSDPSTLLALVHKSFSRQGQSIWFDLNEAHDCMDRLSQRGLAICFVTYNAAAEPIAAAGIVWDWRRSYYILGGYDEAKSHRGGSSLALWHAIMYTCKELRLPEFDLEGSHIPAIERFFRQFAGRPRPFYCITGTSAPLIAGSGASTNAA
jgi:hypothetical protein